MALAGAALVLTAAPAPAQQMGGSAALGAGLFDAEPSAFLDVSVDMDVQQCALSLGGRARYVLDTGFRSEEWDEASEWARVLRHAECLREVASVETSLAVGELGHVALGHGALMRGLVSGLNLDHRRQGAHLLVDGPLLGGEAVLDDVVSPRLAGARGFWNMYGPGVRIEAGLSVAADLAAPEHVDGVLEHTRLPMVSMDGRYQIYTPDHRWAAQTYVEIAAISTMAVGLHVGAEGAFTTLSDARASLRGELRVGNDSYIPNWMGPLYDITRGLSLAPDGGTVPGLTQLERARAGGLGGVGGMAELRASHPDAGELELSYALRAGLPDLIVARLALPYWESWQLAGWLAAEIEDPTVTWAAMAELRARMSERLHGVIEIGRMYRDQDGVSAPLWLASAAVGISFGAGSK